MATTIKVSEETRNQVNDLGSRTSQTADQVVARALQEYERALFWAQYTVAADADVADPEPEEQRRWDLATTHDVGTDA